MPERDTMPQPGGESVLTSQSSSHAHPRRPPASESVSLLHQPRGRRHNDPGALDAATPTVPAARPSYASKHTSSGESSSADRWFEVSNHNIHPSTEDLGDNDPPFFLRNSSSSETPPQAPQEPASLPYPENILRMQNVDSGSEDFRSVIDDLTIENKKLKGRLRKYERLHNAHLESDKLFEIRMHGLPPNKKRELEATLRTFALSLEAAPQAATSRYGSNVYASRLGQQQSTSSLTSTRLADSAYASMSGNNTTTPSGQNEAPRKFHNQRMSTQNIQSYLHEIPVSLLPRHPTGMTEKAKRKLVVRRLEQLFVGKGATIDGHQHPIQQEEVAQSAALADRNMTVGQRAMEEGVREARIVPSTEMDQDVGLGETAQEQRLTEPKGKGSMNSGSESPGQRPTRPLDLDPYRAQVPAENIQYMRHLGFSPPDIGASPGLADDHGWIYLNVLTNMSQLHDINVTPTFVKKAIAEHSKRLELSHDGRKARWKGGSSLTRTSSDGSLEQSTSGSPEHPGKFGAASQNGLQITSLVGTGAAKGHVGNVDRLAYTPLFAHRDESSGDSYSDANMSGWSSPAAEDNPGVFFSQSLPPKKRKEGGGTITFYNNANFCTDLSGDRRAQASNLNSTKPHARVPFRTIGIPDKTNPEAEPTCIAEPKGPLSSPTILAAEAMDIDPQSSSDSDMLLGFPHSASSKESLSVETSGPVEFEASGLGGVQPTDNFSINVKVRRRLSVNTKSTAAAKHRSKMYPSRISNFLTEKEGGSHQQAPTQAFDAEVISSSCKNLPASALPPASFLPLFNSPDDEDYEGSDAESDASLSDGLTDTNQLLPAAVLPLMNWPTLDSSSDHASDTDDEADDDESDGSIDMLAHARLADPVTIQAREREYDGNIAERLAEEIPPGSSAATAGGGSGFNSPRFFQDSSKRPEMAPPLKRPRHGGSFAVDERASKSPKFR